MTEERHWFCFSFQGIDYNNNQVTASTYVGFESRNPLIRKSEIKRQKDYVHLKNGVLIAITYLGFMSKEWFDDE